MGNWYTIDREEAGAKPRGPYSVEELERLARSGRLTKASLVAQPGASDWTPAGERSELRALFRPKVPAAVAVRAVPPASPAQAARSDPAARSTVSLSGVSASYSFQAAFELGWKSTKENWGALVLISLVYSLVVSTLNVPSVLGGNLPRVSPDDRIMLHFVSLVLGVFIGAPLLAGMLYAGVRAARQELQFADLGAGFRKYGAVLSTCLLCVVCIALIVFALSMGLGFFAGLAKGMGGSAVSLVLVCIAAMFLVGVTLCCAVVGSVSLLAAVDPKMGATGGISAMRWAFALVWNDLPSCAALYLLLFLIMSVSIMAVGIGLILLGVPLFFAGVGAAYELLRVQRAAATA